MNSDQYSRANSALEELRTGEMTIEAVPGGTFEVKGEYEVDPQIPKCGCADHEYRETFCKHIVAVKLSLLWGDVTPKFEEENETPPKPDVLIPAFSQIPDTLKEQNQWVAWRQKLHTNKDSSQRWTKVPIDAQTGNFGKSNDSETWTDFDTARKYAERTTTEACGIGFVVSEDDEFVGIDFDDCRDPETGGFTTEVAKLLGQSNSYAEVSPSGTGARVFVKGEKQTGACETELEGEAHVEIYDKLRFLTVTGHHVESTPKTISEDAEFLAEIEQMCVGEASLDDF